MELAISMADAGWRVNQRFKRSPYFALMLIPVTFPLMDAGGYVIGMINLFDCPNISPNKVNRKAGSRTNPIIS